MSKKYQIFLGIFLGIIFITKDIFAMHINEINKEGITVILSTHDVNLAYSWADYIIVMKDGEVAKQGLPEVVFLDDKLI